MDDTRIQEMKDAVIDAARGYIHALKYQDDRCYTHTTRNDLMIRLDDLDAALIPDPWELLEQVMEHGGVWYSPSVVNDYDKASYLDGRIEKALAWHREQQEKR